MIDFQEILEIHSKIYGSEITGISCPVLSQISDIEIKKESLLFIKNYSIHLGSLQPDLQTFDITIINAGTTKHTISSIKINNYYDPIFITCVQHFHKVSLPPNSERRIPITMDLTNQPEMYYYVHGYMFTDENTPLYFTIHFGIEKNGKKLESTDPFQKDALEATLELIDGEIIISDNNEVQKFTLSFHHYLNRFIPTGKFFLDPGLYDPLEQYQLELSNKEHKLLLKSLDEKCLAVFGVPLDNETIFKISDPLGSDINVFKSNELIFDSACRLWEKYIDVNRNEMCLYIKNAEDLDLINLPDWLVFDSVEKNNRWEKLNFHFDYKDLKWGNNNGELEFKFNGDKILLHISVEYLPDTLEILEIPEEIIINDNQKDIIIPIKVGGMGEQSIIIYGAPIEHSGKLYDNSNRSIRFINYSISLMKESLLFETGGTIILQILVPGSKGRLLSFNTKLIKNRAPSISSFKGRIGPLELEYNESYRLFLYYNLEPDEKINDFNLISESHSLLTHKNNEVKVLCYFNDNTNKKYLGSFTLVDINAIELQIEPQSSWSSDRLSLNFNSMVITNKRHIQEPLEVLLNINKSELEVTKSPQLINKYYVEGNIILKNITSYISKVRLPILTDNSIILTTECVNENGTIEVLPYEESIITYSYPVKSTNKGNLVLTFVYNNSKPLVIKI